MNHQLERLKRVQEEIERKNALDRVETERMMKNIMTSASTRTPLKIQNDWLVKASESKGVALRHQSEFQKIMTDLQESSPAVVET